VAGGSGGGSAGGAAGGESTFCGPSTCAGCCRSDGTCNLVPSTQSCGSQGQLCRNCQALGQQCSPASLSCVGGTGGGTGGGGSGGGTGGGIPNDSRLRLFVTTTTFRGNLGGLSGADLRCQTAAAAANKGGTWIALLAGSSTTGLSRVTATGPWYQERADGTFALTYNNVANLQTQALTNITTDEQGQTESFPPRFWTGMNADGTTGTTCNGWTLNSYSYTGTSGRGTVLSDSLGSTQCDSSYGLLCLEQSRLPRPSPLPTVRKRVFVTTTAFSGNLGGLSGADMRCQTAAAAANKGGTWIALLAGSSTTGLSRVTATGPWYQERAGGTFALTYNNVANLQTQALTNITTDEQGQTESFPPRFWTGMNADGTTGTTCNGWTSNSYSYTGTSGRGTVLSDSLGSTQCDSSYGLLCLEQ
jgi:hypothetical protein